METVREYLGMKHNLVGIKILREEVPGDKLEEFRPDTTTQYCRLVREAARGKASIFRVDDLTCPNPIVTLGFEEPVYVDIQPRITPAETKAVQVAPLDEVKDPDIVLMIVSPRQAMEIAILLDGLDVRSTGSMAICGEATAGPYMQNKPNATFLCQGARTYGGYRDNEMVVGLPLETFKTLSAKVEELSKTCGALCGCKTSDISPSIISSLKKQGFEKGTDYFFGKVDGQSVRLYMNKDSSGRIKFITLHLPIKGDVSTEDASITLSKRGTWTDVSITYPMDGGPIELESGKGLKEAINYLKSKVSD